MKFTIMLTLLLAMSTSFIYGQSEQAVRKNDILIDPIYLIAIPVLNISYERLLNTDFGAGVHVLTGLGDEALDGFAQVSPFARMYFGDKYASGFFLEGFVPITSTKDRYDTYDGAGQFLGNNESKETSLGIGIGLGGKWVLKRNVIFELGGGVARRLFYGGDSEPITGKWMIGVGYRF